MRPKRIAHKCFPDHLLEKIEFQDEDPQVIDVTTKGWVASKIVEGKIDCLLNNKVQYTFVILDLLLTNPPLGLVPILSPHQIPWTHSCFPEQY
jgi:hypothetical protein